ncbi:MAG: prepilin-type N-terminal cleavage/methylation domain-containing protein [Prevotella sp.]|nr:prepilin-type N-terminal cleavage/methylation domain-containing protein [Prevotella sp.]
MRAKFKGFTLIELIVVIAIIAILAVVLVPSLMGYIKHARATRLNTNARSVYSAAQLAIVDVNIAQGTVLANCLYRGSDDGLAYPDGGGDEFTLINYLGDNYSGNFAFMTNSEGSGCVYALWSEDTIPAAAPQMSLDDVKASVNTSPAVGCHPLS